MARGPEDTYQPLSNITAASGDASIARTTLASGQGVVSITITGTWVATLVFEAATDPASVTDANATWFSVMGLAVGTLQATSSTTANGNWTMDCGGFSRLRVRCSAFTSGAAVVGLVGSVAPPPGSYVAVNTLPNVTIFSGTSPAAAGTVTQTAVNNLDSYRAALIYAVLAGATGGTLDVYIQSSFANGAAGSWFDVAHYTQIAAAAAAAGFFISLTRGDANVTTTRTINASDNVPVLAANTVVADGFGNALRVVFVAGVGTSAGATQTIKAIFSSQ